MPMGKKAAAMAQWMGNLQRFADLYNGHVFRGEYVIHPEDIAPAKSDTHKLEEDKENKTKEIQRYRDVVMYWEKFGINLAILAIENQQNIHLAMPVRNMVYDGLLYQDQINMMWERIPDEDKKKYVNEEYVSHYRKGQKLTPVITLVLYYGDEEWVINKQLHEMLDMKEIEDNYPELITYIQNYKINLVDVKRIKDIDVFHSDLQFVFGMIKCKENKKELHKYIDTNSEFFSNLDKETALVIGEVLHAKNIIQKAEAVRKGERMNMCQALEDMKKDAMEEGRELMLAELIRKKLAKNKAISEIAEELEETKDVIAEIMQKLKIS